MISTWCSVARPVTPVIVLCNAAVLVVVARNKRMHTPTNYFIVATSSLLLIGLATTTTSTIVRQLLHRQPGRLGHNGHVVVHLGPSGCHTLHYLDYVHLSVPGSTWSTTSPRAGCSAPSSASSTASRRVRRASHRTFPPSHLNPKHLPHCRKLPSRHLPPFRVRVYRRQGLSTEADVHGGSFWGRGSFRGQCSSFSIAGGPLFALCICH